MALKKQKMTHEVITPMEERFSINGKFWLTHYNANNNLTETIDITEGYNLRVLTNLTE